MPTITERQAAWSTLTHTGDEAVTAARTAADRIAGIRQDPNLSDRYRDELIGQQRAQLAEQLAAHRATVNDARRTLLAAAAELSRPTGDTTAQLLAETRQQRAWARIRPQLDAGRGLRDILAEAVTARDDAAVLALAVEAPAWVQANHPRASGLDRLGDGGPDLEGLRQALDVATARVLGDDKGPGTAASLRLHVTAQHPLAVAKLDQAATGGRDLGAAIAVKQAEQTAHAIAAQLGGNATDTDPAS